MSIPDSLETRKYGFAVALLPILVIGGGVLVLVGWGLDSAVLKGIAVDLAPMSPTTAVTFILSGLALWFLLYPQPFPLAPLFSIIVVGIAILVLAGIVFGWQSGIDQLVFVARLQAEVDPSRMSPNTALGFMIIGVALFLTSRSPTYWTRLAQLFIVVGMVIAYFSLIGYIYEIPGFYSVFPYKPMALNTALGFLILGTGALSAQPTSGIMAAWRSPTAGGVLLRFLLPIGLLLPLATGWLEAGGVRLGLFDSEVGEAVFTIANTSLLIMVIWWASRFIDRSDRDRRGSERRLAESEARYRALFERSSDAIMIFDDHGRYLDANPQAERMTGYSREEILSRRVGQFAARPAEGAALFSEVSRNTQVFRDYTLARKDGTEVSVEYSARMIGNGLYQSVYHDITEHKKAEESLRQSLEQERRLNELKSRFVAMVSHEFRTPLAVIRSSTDLLLHYGDRTTPEKRQERLVKIQDEIGVMVQLLDDILFFRRAEDSGVAFNPQSLDLHDFCTTLIGEIQPTIPTHRIEFTTSGDCTRMTADPKLLRQAISNLISNAVKYSPEREGIGLDLICGEKEVILHVRDEGIGIPEEDQSRLFEVFHRASNVGSISGTGLGLPIIKRAVEAHGGSIVVASEVDVGTTFTISLPRRA